MINLVNDVEVIKKKYIQKISMATFNSIEERYFIIFFTAFAENMQSFLCLISKIFKI